ncbi:MAG: hypothetical protein IJD39_03180 [Clostridia bacterium]|nr:hypothetical protein [Clostridia bacterium]
MRTGRKKTVLIMAALIVLAAGVALVGNTLADGVTKSTEAENAIGNYEVEFTYKNQEGNYVSVPADASVQGVSDVTEGMFWCPGRTEIIYLKLDNKELFDTKATISVDVYGTGFGETLTYAVVHGSTPDHPGTWKEFQARAKELEAAGTLPLTGTLKAGAEENPNNYKLLADRLLDNEASNQATANDYYVAFAIHMDENASNAYQGNTMKLDLKLQIDANFQPGTKPTTDTDADKSL